MTIMRNWFTFTLLLLDLVALAVVLFLFKDAPWWVAAALLGAAMVLLVAMYFAMVRPIRTIILGMDLVSSQDFSSRLAKVGYAEADKLVEMFNRMMECLKNERLRQHEQNSFMSLLIEASPMGIAIFDFDARLTMMNPAAASFLGFQSPVKAEGMKLGDFPGELSAAIAMIPQGETHTIRLTDTEIYRCARLSFMEMGFPRPFLLIESLTEEVYRAEKSAYEKVIRMIAHEVNNSMAGLKSLLETVADMMSSEPSICELIEGCHERCVSMSKFITSYADVVKLPQPEKVSCDINGIISGRMAFLEAMAPNGIDLRFEPSQMPATAMVDTVLFEQALLNIVKNAIESIAAGAAGNGYVAISLSANPTTVIVEDNGPGIAPETASHLFTPFFTTKPSGQGLGLMCVSEILRRHGCRFSLATVPGSDSPVTRFTIVFP